MKHEPWSLGASLPGAVTKNGIEWVTLPFRALDAAVLYRVLALRSSIFVVEQECLYQDIDGLDQHTRLNDIMRGADNIRFQTATAFQLLFAAAVMYLALTAIFTRVMTRVERRLKDGSE